MKRETFEIRVNGILIETRSKWNAATKAIESKIKEIAKSESQMYMLSDKESIKGEYGFVQGYRTWKGMKDGRILKFEIKKLGE